MRLGRRGAWLVPALLCVLGAATPAHAQFSFFGPREASPEDVSDTIAEHGFRLVGPLYRNGRVYLADVIDRRQHRERLVVSAETGQILQRFMVDLGPERRPQPAAPRDESFFSHLTRGWDDEPPLRPPLGLDGPDRLPPAAAPRPRSQPKVVTRQDPGPAPVTSSPLPPASSVTAVPTDAAKPETVAVPAPGATKPDTAAAPAAGTAAAPPGVRGTSVSTDPLRIPGTRKPTDEAKPAAVATKAPDPVAAMPKPKPTPVPAAPAADVPVAPLD